jgi:2,3-bisphosphoglycerate-dependent phosphoglycerate mutase
MTEKKSHRGLLVISRHAESEWNLLGKWTGLTDVNLTEKGAHESTMLGELLRDIDFDGAYTSDLKRTKQTLAGIIKGKLADVTVDDKSIKHHPALNERDYGDLTGKNKWEVKDEIGEEAFNGIRRGWDYPVPGGETLKAVHGRVVPYFETEILPRLQAGENILLVAHGNSIRALMKHLEGIDECDMAEVEMPFGTLLMYYFEPDSSLPRTKQTRKIDITPPHA